MSVVLFVPKNEQRPVEFSFHARRRLVQRKVTEEQAAHAVRAGVWEPDGEDGHMKARAHVAGFSLEVPIIVHEDRIFVKTVFWP